MKINSWQKKRIYKLIVDKLYGNLYQKKIAILGFAFKANTNDTRESPAIDICKNLINEGAFLKIHDYKVSLNNIKKELDIDQVNNMSDICLNENFNFVTDVYEATRDADAIIILTEWGNYKKLDWEKIVDNLRKPAWIFDTRLLLNSSDFKDKDVNFWQLGLGC